MIEPTTVQARKTASSTRTGRAELSKSKCALVKGPRPLLKFKFYLDIKNHGVTSKLEAKIKSLGGLIELFLVEQVTHVITDREPCAPGVNSPQLRSVDSLSSNESPQGSAPGGSLRQKTRADAMLEKVRSQATNKCSDPLHNAKLWAIPIWTVHRLLSWLDKVTASIEVTAGAAKTRRVKLISIKAPFLKYEPLPRDARPVYKSLQSWPLIDLAAGACKPAFSIKSNVVTHSSEPRLVSNREELELDGPNEGTMTRKQRTRLSVRNKEQEVDKQALVGGFCEICHCEYREIGEHVRSEQHLNFVKNDANFLELDTLISAGANVEAFLRLNGTTGKDLNNYPLFGRRSLRKLNGKNTPEKYNGTHAQYSPPVTRNKMPRPRTSSNHSPLSPAESDSGHHLRSRGQLWLPPNLLGTTAEDEPYSNKAKDCGKLERKSSCRRLSDDDDTKHTKENAQGSENGARPKRPCPKSKRISADERLVADNKTYYKVEVMTTKLRSSGLGNREHEVARRAQTPIPEQEEQPEDSEEGLVVKFKRVRRSELSVLNDEAENFMFPRKDDATLSDVDTDEAPNTTRSTIRSESSDIKSSETDVKSLLRSRHDLVEDSSSLAGSEADTAPRRRRTRNDTRLDCEESNDAVSVEPESARRRRTRADTKCEPLELEDTDVDQCKRRTRNDTKGDPVELEDSNDVVSVDSLDNNSRRRTRNDTKGDPVEPEHSDDHSQLETHSKRLKRTVDKSESDADDPAERGDASCTGEASPSRKRRRARSENQDADEDSDDHELEQRRKRLKICTELDDAPMDECSADTADENDGLARRKRRRTQAEAFIADNQRYYRFETPGSRLRYQGAMITQEASARTDAANKSGAEEHREVLPVDHDRPRMPRDGLKFSFELLPKSEPWYCTFQRQDKGEEFYTCVSEPGYSQRFYLPYQFSYVMPLNPKLCIDEYNQKRDSYIKTEAAKLDVLVDSPSVNSPAPSEAVTEKSNESDKPLSELQMMKRRRKRRFYANHPRKSPRQHASTLAILSSLIQQRKKRARKSQGDSDASRASLASIPEEIPPVPATIGHETSQRLSETVNSGMDEELEAILTAPMDDLSDLEFHDVDGIVIRDKPDAIELLANYNKAVPLTNPRLAYQTPAPADTVRIVRRKRKKNRTGWPKKKRLFVKRSEVKSEDGNSSVLELDDSRLTELSVEDESGEVELCENEECARRIQTSEDICELASRKQIAGAEDEIITCSSESIVTISSSASSQPDFSAPQQTISDHSEEHSVLNDSDGLQGVPECTDLRKSAPANELVSTDNNNSVNSDILTVKVKQENDDTVIVITNSKLNEVDVKAEGVDVKTEQESLEEISDAALEDSADLVHPKPVLQATNGEYQAVTVIRTLDIPCRRSQRNTSSDCSVAEEVVASQTDKLSGCVHVTLDKWENAEKVLHAKMSENETVPNEKLLQYQPFVRVQKIDNSTLALQNANRRLRSSSSPERKAKAKQRARIMPPSSPRSPRKLRAPRGKWYRER